MRRALSLAAALLTCYGASAAELREIPAGSYRPFFRSEKDVRQIEVNAFRLAATPVTNGEFLEFVRANPQWRRSQVKGLFADREYLQHWAGDLDPGPNSMELPVTFVSWFAAKAFCAWNGTRLPTTAEWEFAASAGFKSSDGRSEPAFRNAITRWYSTPTIVPLPRVGSSPPNIFGVHDLHGLVWEWTSDFNSATVSGDSRDAGSDAQLFCGAGAIGAQDPANFAAFMRFGFRSSLKGSYTLHNLGFRCAGAVHPAKPPCCQELAPAALSAQSLYHLDSAWLSDENQEMKLQALRGRPQVLAMFFASCQYACPIIVQQMKRIEEALPPNLRERIGFTLVSFDAERDTPAALHAYRAQQRLDAGRWTLLHGSADDSRELAALLGVSFEKDARGQFAHSNVITILNSEGEVIQQTIGLNQDVGPALDALKSTGVQKPLPQLR